MQMGELGSVLYIRSSKFSGTQVWSHMLALRSLTRLMPCLFQRGK